MPVERHGDPEWGLWGRACGLCSKLRRLRLVKEAGELERGYGYIHGEHTNACWTHEPVARRFAPRSPPSPTNQSRASMQSASTAYFSSVHSFSSTRSLTSVHGLLAGVVWITGVGACDVRGVTP
ncbi:hypothetical protein AMAG_18747 [Allomyces macrogynus ATCC 38327]|uniref:Uncharacterized protein n=1 Tax=Allomyces macrogynus (strain ATCC 38327) TaxID=578462 RepID=A0A0L0SFA9_ALLM3|nr:hypothetical protein AMAG_18747 [Allomyces macrogynus ATCC 38327]|eukprot:KNE61132.1 hypothetical protein AMAG_18747 [Allomyces macrogynus ATCC 38327]